MEFPRDAELIKARVREALAPIDSAVTKKTKAEKDFLFKAERTDAGRDLPQYYLIYFLFVELLGYKDLGKFEKISWSVPIDYEGTAYLLEHRKSGMGLFAPDKISKEEECKIIVRKIQKAVKISRPYFDWLASQASETSELNVHNHSYKLYERFTFLVAESKKKRNEAEDRKDERNKIEHSSSAWGIEIPYYRLKKEKEWLSLSAIDAFFSFTEHIFIHASVLKGQISTGQEIANFTEKNWPTKFKSCLDIDNSEVKKYYDDLSLIKNQIRNYMAHGAFGKNGEAFQMHSSAGAIPLVMPHKKNQSKFTLEVGKEFDNSEAIQIIEQFIDFYWHSNKFPEIIYIKSGLVTILTFVKNGMYSNAMQSSLDMEIFVESLSMEFDRSANMDW